MFCDFNNEAKYIHIVIDVKVESDLKLWMIHVAVTSIKT